MQTQSTMTDEIKPSADNTNRIVKDKTSSSIQKHIVLSQTFAEQLSFHQPELESLFQTVV